MISKTFGAPFGGTTVAGQYGLESFASRLIVPPKGGAGGGRYFPSIVVVASGEPGLPVVCWASADPAARAARTEADKTNAATLLGWMDGMRGVPADVLSSDCGLALVIFIFLLLTTMKRCIRAVGSTNHHRVR